jgi:predicted regulator of Ras-like GTPase activity (Roadblock/LC7/MglB family)/quercetin dioxygenase-like cupin family protein
MSKADQLAATLDDFLSVSPEVEAAAVVSSDGLPMASALPSYVEEDRLAAMSAALLTLGERAAQGLGKGHLAQVFVEGRQGYVVLMSAGESAVLVAVTSTEAKAGLILFEMRKAARAIEAIMGRAAATPAAPEPAPPQPDAPESAQQRTQPGRVNTGDTGVSIAHMRSPSGWQEPGQCPTFDEYTLVLRGALLVTHEGGELEVKAGQAVHTRPGEWVRYSTPHGAEYIAICLPAFSPETVNRDA